MTRVAFLLWPDTFDDWYSPLGVSREEYLATYDGEWSTALARVLVDGGMDVHLVHGTLGVEEHATQQPSGATAHFVPTTSAYRALRWLAWGHRWWERTQSLQRGAPMAATLSFRLVRELVRLRPDVVVVQDYETLRYDIAAPLLRLAGLHVVGMDTGASARPSAAPWKRWTRGLAHQLLAVHQSEAGRLRAAGHRRVAVWPAPVRTDVLVPGGREAARAQLGVETDARIVFAAARLHPVKNLPLLAEACRDADAELVVAGEGSERARLERAGVRLLGWQSVEQLVTWYAAADVVALSSNSEGQPIAVLEAYACGRAVVATDVGGVPEFVQDGETGWLVPPRDRAALAAALQEALGEQPHTDALGANGRQVVLASHASGAVASAFTRLLRL